MSTSELKPSKLGTKDHWDKVYEEEITNFEENGDEGEIWFGEETIEKMVSWATEHVPGDKLLPPAILEIGTGNGTLLFALADADYPTPRLCGIDYSEGSIKLARSISSSSSKTEKECDKITFEIRNFLTEDPPMLPFQSPYSKPANWDLIMDKGTYDAIALMERDGEGRAPVDGYPERVARLLKPEGYFLITSCNFTEEELKTKFVTSEIGLEYHSRIQHPTYTFGGKSGSIVSSVAFKKPSA